MQSLFLLYGFSLQKMFVVHCIKILRVYSHIKSNTYNFYESNIFPRLNIPKKCHEIANLLLFHVAIVLILKINSCLIFHDILMI